MKLPPDLPTDPAELEHLYNAYVQDEADLDEAELQRIMNARLAAWGLDPQQLTPEQAFSAMAESMSSMLINLYLARDEAPDPAASQQVDEIIRLAEELRDHIDSAARDVQDAQRKS